MIRIQFVITGVLVLATSAFAGRIVVDNDEWTLSNTGFTSAGVTTTSTYATNAAAFLTGASSGANIWIDSDNFGLTGSMLQSALGAYTLTDTGSFTAFTSASLSTFKAVFLGGDVLTATEIAALTSYVNTGGAVYIAAGTGCCGGAATEATNFNGFLNVFGLTLAPVYNGVTGNVAVSSTSPVLTGVAQLFYDNGNDVNLFGSNPGAKVITSTGDNGLIGTFSGTVSATPEPSTLILVGFGAIAVGLGRKLTRSRT